MVDRNDRSAPQSFRPQRSVLFPVTPPSAPVPEPIWRYRPPLQPVDVGKSPRNRMLPQVEPHALASNVAASADRDTPSEVKQLTLLTLGSDEAVALAYVQSLIAQGTPTDLIFPNLLTPTARLLGRMWQADTTDFANVTLAVSRLQRILHLTGESFAAVGPVTGAGAVMLTAQFGEQHGFGLAMVAEFFRRDGWDICTGPFPSRGELCARVHDRWFDIVGFSVASDRKLDQLRDDIQDVRRDSRNQKVGIVVGGPMLIEHPELVNSLGADLSAVDASIAPQLARNLLRVIAGEADAGHSQLRSALL